MPTDASEITNIEIIWDVPGFDRTLPDGDDYPLGKVYAGGWTASYAKDGQSAYSYGSVGFGEADPANYTPFSQITKEQALEWVQAILGEDQVKAIEESLKTQVEEKLNPSHANDAPWRSQESS